MLLLLMVLMLLVHLTLFDARVLQGTLGEVRLQQCIVVERLQIRTDGGGRRMGCMAGLQVMLLVVRIVEGMWWHKMIVVVMVVVDGRLGQHRRWHFVGDGDERTEQTGRTAVHVNDIGEAMVLGRRLLLLRWRRLVFLCRCGLSL